MMIERFTGVVLAAGLGAIGITSLATLETQSAIADGWSDGDTQQSLESSFNDALPHRALSISLWRSVEFLLFGVAAEGAVVGKDGWLFTDEEYAFPPQADAQMERHLTTIADVASQLDDRGVHLVVALLPDKARIYSEKLAKPRPNGVLPRYLQTLAFLADQGIAAPNLIPALEGAKPDGPVYLARDTHWTPLGAQTVARAIAAELTGQPLTTSAFVAVARDPITVTGDLMNFLDVGAFAGALGMPEEVIPQTGIALDGTGLGLFGDAPPIEVVLVGTSYSADPRWQFVDFLQLETGSQVLNAAEIGQGPFQPMLDFLNDGIEAEPELSVVIWEIPERYLSRQEN